jgi:hypothetical protein
MNTGPVVSPEKQISQLMIALPLFGCNNVYGVHTDHHCAAESNVRLDSNSLNFSHANIIVAPVGLAFEYPAMSRNPFGCRLTPAGRFTLDKRKHFVDSAKAPCPVYKGFWSVRPCEVSTKRLSLLLAYCDEGV